LLIEHNGGARLGKASSVLALVVVGCSGQGIRMAGRPAMASSDRVKAPARATTRLARWYSVAMSSMKGRALNSVEDAQGAIAFFAPSRSLARFGEQ